MDFKIETVLCIYVNLRILRPNGATKIFLPGKLRLDLPSGEQNPSFNFLKKADRYQRIEKQFATRIDLSPPT